MRSLVLCWCSVYCVGVCVIDVGTVCVTVCDDVLVLCS